MSEYFKEPGEEQDSSPSRSVSPSSRSSDLSSEDAEWVPFLEEDGSLTYIESYVSSILKERQSQQAAKSVAESDKKNIFTPFTNIKRQTKLLGLLKRRPSVRAKSNSTAYDQFGNQESVSPKVTFRDTPSGEIRYITLNITDVGTNFGRRATLCESVLRIVPGRFSEPPDSRIMVAGLSPGSQVLREGLIKIGDWLREMNGKEVDWENLDSVLMDIHVPSTVTIAVQKCAEETLSPDDNQQAKKLTQTRLVQTISGKEQKLDHWEKMIENGSVPLHVVLYLSLSGINEDSPDKADIRYQFPASNSKFVDVRGMFLTLCHSLGQILSKSVTRAVVTLHGVPYNCTFCPEGEDVFIIIIPQFCLSEAEASSLMSQASKLIKFQFGTLAKCFCNAANQSYLDRLFLFIMETALTIDEGGQIEAGERPVPTLPEPQDLRGYPGSRAKLLFGRPVNLVIPNEHAKVQIEMCLNELQSGEFGDTGSECEDCLLLYNIIGCCLFYKGRLVLSHLDAEVTELVYLVSEHHRVLHLVQNEALSRLVIWKRVFLPQEPSELALAPPEEIDHYLLMVAMNHMMLATVVESGNITNRMDLDAGPDPLLVDQVETTLYHLHSLHVHTICEESLLWNPFDTISLDSKINGSSPSKNPKTKGSPNNPTTAQTRLPDVPSILKQKTTTSFSTVEAPLCDCGPPGAPLVPPDDLDDTIPSSEEDPDGNSSRDGTSSDSDWRIGKGSDFRTDSAFQSENVSSDAPSIPLRITAGNESVLFHVVQLDYGDGVIASPCSEGDSGVLQSHVRNFFAAVAKIRHILLASARNKNVSGLLYLDSNVLNGVKEAGLLFDFDAPSKSKARGPVQYWVVGRIYGDAYEREVYVALEDSIAQNMQEIAFSLALGCS